MPQRPILPVTVYGPASVGVPGAVAAWCEAHGRFGRLPLARVLAPSVELAAGGFPVSAGLTSALARRRERLQAGASGWSGLAAVTGSTLRQPELARTLEAIRVDGAAGFYTGPVARAIAAAAATPDGRGVTVHDLADYCGAGEAPLTGVYGRARLAVVPPPSQAVLALLALNALEGRAATGHGRRGARRDRGDQGGLRASRRARRRRRRGGAAQHADRACRGPRQRPAQSHRLRSHRRRGRRRPRRPRRLDAGQRVSRVRIRRAGPGRRVPAQQPAQRPGWPPSLTWPTCRRAGDPVTRCRR